MFDPKKFYTCYSNSLQVKILHIHCCSFAKRKPNESMKFIVIFFFGGFLGLFIGLSLPTFSTTKVLKFSIFCISCYLILEWNFNYAFNFSQLNLPSSLLPSIDLSCIRGSDAWSFVKNGDSASSENHNPSKVCILFCTSVHDNQKIDTYFHDFVCRFGFQQILEVLKDYLPGLLVLSPTFSCADYGVFPVR